MNTNMPEQYKLIDGTFSPEDAKTVLLTLVNDKINYHKMEHFSHHERFGKDLKHSAKRIEELEKLSVELVQKLNSATEQNAQVKINGYIELQFIKP